MTEIIDSIWMDLEAEGIVRPTCSIAENGFVTYTGEVPGETRERIETLVSARIAGGLAMVEFGEEGA